MLNKIKTLADEAIKLQNKNRMDEVLREISAMCDVKEEEKKIADAEYVKEHGTFGLAQVVKEGYKNIQKNKKGAKDAE